MKSSLLTATGCLAVVMFAAATVNGQTYPSSSWDNHRTGPQSDSHSYGFSYPNTDSVQPSSSYTTGYGVSYPTTNRNPYISTQDVSPGSPSGVPSGQTSRTYSHAPPASAPLSIVPDATDQAQPAPPQPEPSMSVTYPDYGGTADCYDGMGEIIDGCDPCQAKPGQWMVSADAVYMTRVPGNNYALLRAPALGPVALDVADFDFDYEFGWRVATSRMLRDCWGIETGFFTMSGGWDYDQTLTGNLELQGPGWVVLDAAGIFRTRNTSDFNRGELNVVRGICDWATLRLGVGYIDFNDRLQVDELVPPASTLLISTANNDLVGPQFGADFKLLELGGRSAGSFADQCSNYAAMYGLGDGTLANRVAASGGGGRFRVNATINCGVFYNHIEHAVTSPGIGPTLAGEANEVALLGEAALTAKYRVTDHVAIRGGYQVLALYGVALGPDQIANSNVVTATTSTEIGSLIAHGATLGIEVFW